LAKDLATANSLRDAEIHRLLVEESVETPGAEPWATIIGNYEFDRSDQDLALLAGMGSIAKASGAPFIAAAAAELIGCSGPSDDVTLNLDGLSNNSAWQELRASPTAAYLGLAWPKFLVRLPYGSATRPIDTFDYEELAGKTGETANVNLLWGNSAFLAALLLGQAYSESDWSMQPGDCLEVEGLPAWTYEEDGEPQLHPCGQYLLTQRPIESLQSAGFMPIVSIRDSDTIRLGGFYSLMSKRLSGPWD
jgi:type VI secretion system protein ImpC